MEYPVVNIIDGQPTFEKPLSVLLSTLKKGGALKVLDPLEYITERQRRWYKGVCLPFLAKQSGDANATEWWDTEVKRRCNGLSLLKKEIFFIEDIMGNRIPIGRLTTSGVGKRNMMKFINEILEYKEWSDENGKRIIIPPPDPSLRSK